MNIVLHVVFSPDDQFLVASKIYASVLVYDVEFDEKIREFKYGRAVRSVTYSPTGQIFVICSDGPVAILNIKKKIREFSHNKPITTIMFMPDGRYLVFSEGKEIMIHDLMTDDIIYTFMHGSRINSIDISPDGKFIVSGSSDRTARIWHIKKGETKRFSHKYAVHWVSLSKDGQFLMTVSSTTFSDSVGRIFKWRKRQLVWASEGVSEIIWFKRFPALRTTGWDLSSEFMLLPCMDITTANFSRRGFLAIGYTNGEIEIIREGKGI